MKITPLLGLSAALAMTLAASAASAQTAPPADYGHADHQRMEGMMQKHREAMSRDLHAILNIRPDQEAAFAAFESATMDGPRLEHRKWGDQEAMTTPQRLDQMVSRMDEHMARMRVQVQATKTFYAALSPDQQRAFDALERMHRHHGSEGRGEHRWEGGPPGPGGDGRRPPPPSGD